MQHANEALMDAVAACDLKAVQRCLENGADPNFIRLSEKETPNGYLQPYSPLRMVVFRISDVSMVEEEFAQLFSITELLLRLGADPKPALELAEWRYGPYAPVEENNSFMNIWGLLANAR